MNPVLALMPAPQGGEGQGGPGGLFLSLLPFLLIFLIFYLLVIRPQAKRQREVQKMLSELKAGDRVVTSGGLFGTVFSLKDDNVVVLKISDQVKVEVAKSAVTGVVQKSRES
jgi:preprotein translocase subunit YajC